MKLIKYLIVAVGIVMLSGCSCLDNLCGGGRYYGCGGGDCFYDNYHQTYLSYERAREDKVVQGLGGAMYQDRF